MNPPTPSRFPRIVTREATHAGLDEAAYVRVAVFLAVVTAIEVAIYYVNIPRALFITILVVLASVKFGTVAALFMHLKFDGKLLSYIFVTGLALISVLALVVITTVHSMP